MTAPRPAETRLADWDAALEAMVAILDRDRTEPYRTSRDLARVLLHAVKVKVLVSAPPAPEPSGAAIAIRHVLNGEPQENGEYLHLVECSGDRRQPPGTLGVSCVCRPSGPRPALEPSNQAPRAPSAAAIEAALRAFSASDEVGEDESVQDFKRRLMAKAIRAYLAVSAPPAPEPSEAAMLAFLKAVSLIEDGLLLHEEWERSLRAGLEAAYAVDRPHPDGLK